MIITGWSLAGPSSPGLIDMMLVYDDDLQRQLGGCLPSKLFTSVNTDADSVSHSHADDSILINNDHLQVKR